MSTHITYSNTYTDTAVVAITACILFIYIIIFITSLTVLSAETFPVMARATD